MIGGAQGSGVDTSANIFARAAAQGGYHVFWEERVLFQHKGRTQLLPGKSEPESDTLSRRHC